MTAARRQFAFESKDRPVPARLAPAHQEINVHKTLLSAVAAIGLLIPAGYASAQDSDSVNINTVVTAHCGELEIAPAPVNLGELADSDGFLNPAVLDGDEGHTFPAFWCNSPVEVSLTATPLENTDVASVVDPAFTRSVNFVATLAWDDVSEDDDSADPAATTFTTAEANTGDLVLQVTNLDADDLKLVAGAYAGSITVTFTLP